MESSHGLVWINFLFLGLKQTIMRIIQVCYSNEIHVWTIDIICEDKNSLSSKIGPIQWVFNGNLGNVSNENEFTLNENHHSQRPQLGSKLKLSSTQEQANMH